ncbi:MAG: (2Fe-2S)-binding protein, partial [Gammaproteobacteria bacterium]
MVKLNVNGQVVETDASGDTPVLWVLRDHLGMTGTKFGCGAAYCGACTVHLDGEPVRSCQLTLDAAAGHRITTIEGVSPDRSHPVQLAWMELDVPQCGYCQSGQIMSATVLLARNPSPTDADIDAAMAGNLCRCG